MKFLLPLLAVVALSQAEIFYDDILFGTQYGMENYYNTQTPGAPVPVAPSSTNNPLEVIGVTPINSYWLTNAEDYASSVNGVYEFGYGIATVGDQFLAPIASLPTSFTPMTSYSLGHFNLGGESFDFTLNFTPFMDGINMVRTAALVVMICGFAFTIASTMRGYI